MTNEEHRKWNEIDRAIAQRCKPTERFNSDEWQAWAANETYRMQTGYDKRYKRR